VITVLLVRHAHTADLGRRLSGRAPGVHLSEEGIRAAERVAERLSSAPLSAVYASPIERAGETATMIAQAHRVPVTRAPDWTEIDFGEWTGRSYEELDQREDWRRFNMQPEIAEIPAGERLTGVGRRGCAALRALAETHVNSVNTTVAVVTHGDVIRLTLAHMLAMPISAFRRFEIEPASVTRLHIDNNGFTLVTLNEHEEEV